MASTSHIKTIKVISNTHWDREFRHSFERTRKNLLVMMDKLLDILETDSDYQSYTLDGHTILVDDYLEMRPEKKETVKRLIESKRLIAGPWHTLPEQFSIPHEALVRNLLYGRKTIIKHGGEPGTVAYTPASWGQTGQLPQILRQFGLDKVMFYRGISHHESDAEFLWQAPDGSEVWASRFGLYARYNWYYQVHRPATRNGRVFDKQYHWGEFDEVPCRLADSTGEDDPSFGLKDPCPAYDPSIVAEAIEKMIAAEGEHFTTPVFPAMHGHDISVAHPRETEIIRDARKALGHIYRIEQSNLEDFWHEVINHIDKKKLSLLTGERRSYLKKGMWTYLFPATISARTYLKQADFRAGLQLTSYAEPLASLTFSLGDRYPEKYTDRAWKYLLANHTHDANGGCAPDKVCLDMEYRYRKTVDICDIVTEDAMSYVARNINAGTSGRKAIQCILFNPLPFVRDAIVRTDLEIPSEFGARSVKLVHNKETHTEYQPLSNEKSSVFVDSIWDVPTILESDRMVFYAHFKNLPPLGYRCYEVVPLKDQVYDNTSLITGTNTMENEHIHITVNNNGTVTIIHKDTGHTYHELNYLTDQGEGGNAWQHEDLEHDQKINSLGVSCQISVTESGPLVSTLTARFSLLLPVDYDDGRRRNSVTAEMPVRMDYTLEKNTRYLKVKCSLTNNAKDHWLRVNFPSGIKTSHSVADSHFDVIRRPVTLPDPSGWVEQPRGTHPLRTFVDVSDGQAGLACFTKGLFEYEVFDDETGTLAVTLIRACRIRLKVSEEKTTERSDEGIQCPGKHVFEYAICPHHGDYTDARLIRLAAEYHTPARALMAGRGKGSLSTEAFLFDIDNTNVHVTAVKMAEDRSGLIIRMFNSTNVNQPVQINFPFAVTAFKVRMDEQGQTRIPAKETTIEYSLQRKEILTLKITNLGSPAKHKQASGTQVDATPEKNAGYE